MRRTERREFACATIAVMARGTAVCAVSSDRLPHFQGLPLALVGHVTSTLMVPVGFQDVVRLAPEAQVDSGVRAVLPPRMSVRKSRPRVSLQRCPSSPTKPQRPSSRVHTSRRTARWPATPGPAFTRTRPAYPKLKLEALHASRAAAYTRSTGSRQEMTSIGTVCPAPNGSIVQPSP